MYRVDVYLRVRRAVMVDGMSMREAARTFGLHRDTVRKMLAYSVPPGYRRQTPPKRPKLKPFTGVIDRILEDDCPASTIFAGWRQLVLPVHLLGLDALLGSVAVRPSYMCKSEPQIQEEVIFTMPSLGCCSSGSGTFSAAILNGAW